MGKILAVWSGAKQTGKSITTYMLANEIIKHSERNFKLLVCCLNLKFSSLYKLFGVEVTSLGIQDLLNYHTIMDSDSQLLKNAIPRAGDIYFAGSYKMTNSYAQRNLSRYGELINGLKEQFDLIIFDTVSGRQNALTNLVLQRTDIILKLYNQDMDSIDSLSCMEESSQYNQEVVHLISKYRNIYPRASDLKKRYSLKGVYTMDYCETLQEMKNRNSLHLYLQRETQCNEAITLVSEKLLETLGIPQIKNTYKQKIIRPVRSLERVFRRTRVQPNE